MGNEAFPFNFTRQRAIILLFREEDSSRSVAEIRISTAAALSIRVLGASARDLRRTKPAICPRRFLHLAGGLTPLLLAMTLTTGCGPAARIEVLQTQLSGWQRNFSLQSKQAYWADGQDEPLRVLAEFPLPGATQGQTMFLLYFRVAGDDHDVTFDQRHPVVRGFLIQLRGENAGLVMLDRGRVEIHGSSKAREASRRIELEVTCEDGTMLKGSLSAKQNRGLVDQFEHRHTADVNRLLEAPAPTPTATP